MRGCQLVQRPALLIAHLPHQAPAPVALNRLQNVLRKATLTLLSAQADGSYSGASSGSGASAAPSHLKSLAGGLTRPLVRGFTTLIGVVAGASEGSGGGGGGNDGTSSSSGSISAAAAAAGSAGSAGSGGSSVTTGAVLAPPPQGRRTGSTTAGSAAASTLATTSAESGAASPPAHSDAPQPPAPGAPALQGHMRADVPPAAAAAAATDADALLTHSPNADPFDFWSVDVAEPCLAALLPPLPPLEHVVGDFVVRTGPHELANALFGHQSPVTARVADGMVRVADGGENAYLCVCLLAGPWRA